MSEISKLALELRKLKDQKDDLAEKTKAINLRIEEICNKDLPTAMDDDGVSNVVVDGAGRVTLRGELYVSILAENREAAYEWMRQTGRGSLITETVNASSLKAAAKEWLKKNEEIPSSIKVTPVTVATLTKV